MNGYYHQRVFGMEVQVWVAGVLKRDKEGEGKGGRKRRVCACVKECLRSAENTWK